MGNRLTKTNELPPQDNETTNYTYDDENRLTKVVITKNAKQKELTFTYDPFGRRITKTLTKDEIGTDCTAPNACPRTTTYVYDNQSIIAEYDTNNEIQKRYTHGPNIDEPLAIEIKSGATYTPYYYHADGLGSITSISNASGAVVQRYAYDSFGNQAITTNGNINQPYTYTSREYDTETGMYFYRARYYDPKVGRFVTKDPIGFSGGDVNLYGYTRNNPINLTDPSGNTPAGNEYCDAKRKNCLNVFLACMGNSVIGPGWTTFFMAGGEAAGYAAMYRGYFSLASRLPGYGMAIAVGGSALYCQWEVMKCLGDY